MSTHTFKVPPNDRYFEDYEVGATYEFGPISVTEEEIIAFAKQFDPQPFHVDPKAAKDTYYGGVIASGWHTAGLMMRLYVDNYLSTVASLGSPGIDELRWPQPVRPGDTLRVRLTIANARRSRSKPDRGIVHTETVVVNQNEDVVMTMKGINMFLCRKPEG